MGARACKSFVVVLSGLHLSYMTEGDRVHPRPEYISHLNKQATTPYARSERLLR